MDTLGLLLAVVVTAACVQDRDGAIPVLGRMRRTCLRIAVAWADSAYAGRVCVVTTPRGVSGCGVHGPRATGRSRLLS